MFLDEFGLALGGNRHGLFPSNLLLWIEAPHDLQPSGRSLYQRDGSPVAVPSPIKPVVRAFPGPDANLTDRPCPLRGQVPRRDFAIGRAAGGERVCQYVSMPVGA